MDQDIGISLRPLSPLPRAGSGRAGAGLQRERIHRQEARA